MGVFSATQDIYHYVIIVFQLFNDKVSRPADSAPRANRPHSFEDGA